MAGVQLSFTLYFIGLLFLTGISYKLYLGIICSIMVFILIAVIVTSVVTWRHRHKKLIAVRAVAGRTEKGLATPTAVSHSSSSSIRHHQPSIRHHQSAQELRHMCIAQPLPSQPLTVCGYGSELHLTCGCGSEMRPTCGCGSEPVCGCGSEPGCGNVGCSLSNSQPRVVVCRQLSAPCCSHSATAIPVASNTAYTAESQVVLGTNPAYTLRAQDQALPTPPFAPPPPPSYNEVNKVKSV